MEEMVVVSHGLSWHPTGKGDDVHFHTRRRRGGGAGARGEGNLRQLVFVVCLVMLGTTVVG